MVNYFIYAKEFSTTGAGDEYYNNNCSKTLEQFKCDVAKIKEELVISEEPPMESKIIYLHWGEKCLEVDEDEIKTCFEPKGLYVDTKPKSIIRWLQNDFGDTDFNIKLLYIITTGLISYKSAQNFLQSNGNMVYGKVVIHALNTFPENIDLCVAATFSKSPCTIYRNNELYENVDIQKFDYDKINLCDFATEKHRLMSYLRMKFIKNIRQDVAALEEIDKLKKLRNRLFDELSANKNSENLAVSLETKDRNVFLREFRNTLWYKNLNSSVCVNKVYVEKSISSLINFIISAVKSAAFDEMKFVTTYNKTVKEEPIVDVNFPEEQEIEFPDIILDDEKGIPVIILTTFNLMESMIFHSKCTEKKCIRKVTPASFRQFKSAMDCPLILMEDKYISESIGYFYTLNVYKELLANNKMTEPRTRRDFNGGLVLTETDQFDKYNDYVLSATYFYFKKINYNVGLFYFMLWKHCESKEWMDRNVLEQFKKYVMRRISETVCKIGLSSLPLDPQENTSLLTALWYCVELSSCIFKDDPKNFNHERLRMYHGVAPSMIEILKHFNYDLNLDSIEKRIELIEHVMILKRIQGTRQKFYYMLQKIFKTVEGFLVSEIENPCNLYKLNYLKLHHKEVLRDDVIGETVHLNDYIHLMHFIVDLNASEAGEGAFDICEKTFRPFFVIDRNTSFYSELLKITKKVVINNDDDKDKINVAYEATDTFEFDRFPSLYKMFINCVEKLKKNPTLPEYIDYVTRRKKFSRDLVTIFPTNIYSLAKGVYEHYQKVMPKVEVYKLIEIGKKYVNRFDRIKAEERVNFNTDNEISEFISSEESKVNLRKRE